MSTIFGSDGSPSSFSRSRRTCTVTVEVSPKSQPQTRRSSSCLAEGLAGVDGEEREQVELPGGQREQLAAAAPARAAWPTRGDVDVHGPDRRLLVEQLGAGQPLGAPQQGLDPQHDLARGERLDHVVVGAGLQTDQPVLLLAAGRQHDDGGVVAGVRRRRRRTSSPDSPGSIRSRMTTSGLVRCHSCEGLGRRRRSSRPGSRPARGRRCSTSATVRSSSTTRMRAVIPAA